MGRGAAAEMRKHFPYAETTFGALVKKHAVKDEHGYLRYGVLLFETMRKPRWGIFQVKHYWGKPAIPELIVYSVDCLCYIAARYESISLNYPGIDNGGLTREAVEPLIERLPDNVTVWTR